MSANHWVDDDCKMPQYDLLDVDGSIIPSIISKLSRLVR